ncbi:MAG: tRNA (adenosine(37)-N6)-threonylcarbamoyltransferase complex dimerization subunit type 1 TsaB [Oscillospiraceae bacterium]|nr:tRNA (adenosine(37)-N6)-threonylcarbamoyltransferase complex dimerization subunit type 1 TsaB [Oscillospiraceae bacterium]
MKILGFESSAKSAGVALMEDGVLLAEAFQNTGLTHSATLLPMAQDLLSRCNLQVSDVSVVAVANGPGSFTGLRIGLAAAKGLAWGREVPVLGVSTLEAMAYGILPFRGIIVACMDARRNEVYNAIFESDGETITRLSPDRAISVEELKKELESYEKEKILVGDGAQLCYNTFCGLPSVHLAPAHRRFQHAAGVVLAAKAQLEQGNFPSNEELSLNYLRLSQAERERAEKLKQKGEV